jgi:3-deoxy-D-manno-octulosonate 8-phosphate phosphatase (KDO 8-P phosphatase)
MDVDGVLTDGSMITGDKGIHVKEFNVRDGFGIVLARRAGLKTGFLTAEESRAVAVRAKKLEIDWVAQGARDKAAAFRECLAHFRLKPEQVSYIGDDLIDLPVLRRVGLSASVADGHPEVKRRVDYLSPLPGGRGAVRDLIELILRAQGHWPKILRRFLS